MMKKTDILIIGGGPAGIAAAVTARKNNPNIKITLIRDKEKAVIPCGIPYIFKRLDSAEKNIMPDKPLEANQIELIIDRVKKIEPGLKKIESRKGMMIGFDKLIIATGSEPCLVPIDGIEQKGVWQIRKDADYLERLRDEVLKSKKIVIIGGGFIGVELAEELSQIAGLKISLIERLDHCLMTTFDEEFAVAAEDQLRQQGIKIISQKTVEEIEGDGVVKAVKLDDGQKIPADVVILSIGAKPNIKVARKAGLKIGELGGICVDEYMRTNLEDIFAAGDCAETRDFFTEKNLPVMLASTATAEARIAGASLYQLKFLRENKGTLGSFSTRVGNLVIGATGMTEQTARKEKFEIVIGRSEAPNHHPAALPETEIIKTKLIFANSSGTLLGGQIMGPESISEMINILALAIQRETTVYDFNSLQISTHPLLTASPIVYPLIAAAQEALENI